MKTTIKSLVIGGSMLIAASAHAELETEIHTGYHTQYEFRGVDFGDDLYEAGIDFSYALSEGLSLSGGLWFADNDVGDELDLYVGLSKTIGPVEVSVGYIRYEFPGDGDFDTDEVYIGLGYELACGVGLSLTYYEDIGEIEGGYLELGASKSFELSECVGLDLAAGAAWSFDYNGDVDGGGLDDFNHWYVSVALPWEFRDGVTLTPYVKYVDPTDDLVGGLDDVYGGVSLSVSF